MKIKVLGSSSSGNGYILDLDTEALVIEAGVKASEVKQALKFNISKVAGCVVSHEHGDHSAYANEYIGVGFDVYMTQGTASRLKFTNNRKPKLLQPNTLIQIGNFKVLPFDVEHDAIEPVGFLIKHKAIGTVLFITDTYYSKYKFSSLNHLLVEANYCEEIVEDAVINGTLHPAQYRRLRKSHMSIQTCKELLKANDLSKVENIVLIHLSDRNSNAESFKRQVQGLTGIPVTIADKGVEIYF